MKQQNYFAGKAFTLIELLIVVLIIAILAAIAVPNFLEFQTRAKVSRARSDMRNLAVAIEAYTVDNGTFPASGVDAPYGNGFLEANYFGSVFALVTTPIAYMTRYPDDVFAKDLFAGSDTRLFLDYRRTFETRFGTQRIIDDIGTGSTFPKNATARATGYMIYSEGPDRESNIDQKMAGGVTVGGFGDPLSTWALYDPTNGTVSVGDLIRANYAVDESALFSYAQ